MTYVRSQFVRRALVGLLLAMSASFVLVSRVEAQVVTKNSDLSFGTIFTGTTTSVAITDSRAAKWTVTSLITLLNTISFVLPTTLTRTGPGPGTGSMTITYCSTCAGFSTTNNPAGATKFDPHNSANPSILSLLSTLYIWLGGSVSPPLNLPAGNYSASVQVTVTTIL